MAHLASYSNDIIMKIGRINASQAIKHFAIVILGLLLPFVIVFAYFYLKSALGDMFYWNIL